MRMRGDDRQEPITRDKPGNEGIITPFSRERRTTHCRCPECGKRGVGILGQCFLVRVSRFLFLQSLQRLYAIFQLLHPPFSLLRTLSEVLASLNAPPHFFLPIAHRFFELVQVLRMIFLRHPRLFHERSARGIVQDMPEPPRPLQPSLDSVPVLCLDEVRQHVLIVHRLR